ncbi:MAG: hypothetical protein KPEEDBHJ_03506 [Anaerolineales bacterium]|nr:hypothetical protein [Anaerolineales bacterium]
MKRTFPWINRRAADEIYKGILAQKDDEKKGVTVYLVKAPAGAGKTFLARDIGTRLGSADGYEPSAKNGIMWSGILDLYDPDTNNNRGIESLLIQSFSQTPEAAFKEYYAERKIYVKLATGGTGGPPLEEQRLIVERTFSSDIRKIARENHLVWAFDTVERLQSALDPTEAALGQIGDLDDTSSVTGWLLNQITRLSNATILLFGRPVERLEPRIQAVIDEANFNRDRSFGRIRFESKDLSFLSEDETSGFFAFREATYPNLKKILTRENKKVLAEGAKYNPLLMDIALQAILTTGKFSDVRKALDKKDDMSETGKMLLGVYMNHSRPETRTILQYLALARNGLTPDLLAALEPSEYGPLETELRAFASLPFVKTRKLPKRSPASRKRDQNITYFLHDAMYAICDTVIWKPAQVRDNCKKIVGWYDGKIAALLKAEGGQQSADSGERKDDPISDLLVESLFYRLRSSPKDGYLWYLEQADQAFRKVKTGFEMRLRDAMAQFAVNADPKGHEDSASSVLDRESIAALMPDLWDQFRIDSAMMWVRRLSFRGRHEEATRVAEKAVWAEQIYRRDKNLYRASYAELGIWQAQSLMYLGKIKEASKIYEGNLDVLAYFSLKKLEAERKRLKEYELKRICFVKGRTHNNLGYTYWMYLGKNKAALIELSEALKYFELAQLTDEEATTLDNMGRIHAALWHEPPALLHVEKGLKKRQDDQSRYRVAMSQISLASILHRFRYPYQALENVEKAYDTFTGMSVERGKGLALLTRAMIRRSMSESKEDYGLSREQSLEYIQSAISDLDGARRIFKDSVQETIRYVYVLNELGSCHRSLYLLQTQGNASRKETQITFKNGVDRYTEAIALAEKYDYFMERLDSKQDLAVLYFRAREHEKAMLELNQILAETPDGYKFRPNIKPKSMPDAKVTDAYFKLLGQVEALIGAIIFDRMMSAKTMDIKRAQEALEHYLLSVAYYYRYSSISANTYIKATERIYNRFSRCDRETTLKLAKYVDKLIQKYRIPPEWVKPLFDQLFVMLGVYPVK